VPLPHGNQQRWPGILAAQGKGLLPLLNASPDILSSIFNIFSLDGDFLLLPMLGLQCAFSIERD
jgi:hypothetical protein